MLKHTIAPFSKKSNRRIRLTPAEIRKRRSRLPFKDARCEAALLRDGLIPAVEDEGFWKDCWMGFVAWNWAGDRIWLDKPDRRAMRRLLMEGTWPDLIDLAKQQGREELDRRLRREERRSERGWSGYL